jgi:hypothetical protein
MPERNLNVGEIKWEITCFACPVSVTGVVDDREFNFRARHGDWAFTITEPEQDPHPPQIVYERMGVDDQDGFMDHEIAIGIILACILEWKQGHDGMPPVLPDPNDYVDTTGDQR